MLNNACSLLHLQRGAKIKGVIFDLDGTLTVPVLDFNKLRLQLNVPLGGDILSTVDSLPIPEREKAHQIIQKFEQEGREKFEIQPGLFPMIEYLKTKSIHHAIFTRNSVQSVDQFLQRTKLTFQPILTRDFLPTKPAPDGAHFICSKWSLRPEECLFVGDGAYDIACGSKAGMITVLLLNDFNADLKDQANFFIKNLDEIPRLFEERFEI